MPKVVPGYKTEARARIIAAARRLFIARGFRRTTMDDVAKELGVSKGALYLYYRSKVELLREISSDHRRDARRWLAESLGRTDPVVGFAEVFEEALRAELNPEEIALWFEILGEASHDPKIREALRVDAREDARNLRRFLEELRRRGHLAWDGDLEVLAFVVVALFQGTVWNLSVGFDAGRSREILRAALTTVLTGPERPGAPRSAAATGRGSRRTRA